MKPKFNFFKRNRTSVLDKELAQFITNKSKKEMTPMEALGVLTTIARQGACAAKPEIISDTYHKQVCEAEEVLVNYLIKTDYPG